ncbi:molybdopterin-synthase adenylyltransferase MoeB [Halomonas denitrificans]|nr:molybdopterin-synthase adenylyltransferase MoeB [Halomonas denitrificans]
MAGPERKDRLTPSEARRAFVDGAIRLVDIRRRDEWLLGTPSGAEHRTVEELLAGAAPGAQRAVLICGSGRRSRAGADALRAAGIDAADVEGGFEAWRRHALPVDVPDSELSLRERERYQRHLALPSFGEAGQLALKRSRVLLVGCGGLGSPAAMYLAAAGVGRLTLVDDDRVERSNLQRQVIHDEAGLGRAKAASARERLAALNPDVELAAIDQRLDENLAERLVPAHDLVVDGSDNFPTRCVVNRACVRARTPLVYGAVERFEGQVGLFHPGSPDGACYRCLFPDLDAESAAMSCAEAGVLGVLPGIIGAMQALEAIKWLTADRAGAPAASLPVGWVATFEGLAGRWRRFDVPRDPGCPECGVDRSGTQPGP